jgi:signal transduction histidine kinase
VSSAPTSSAEATDLPARLARSYARILEHLCGGADLPAAGDDVLREVVRAVGCEAATLRVYDRKGGYPRLAHVNPGTGSPHEEGSPPEKDAPNDVVAADSRPSVTEILRDIVIGGRTDPSRSFFTPGGSFWTNSLGSLLSGELGEELGAVSGGAGGYESVAVAPVRSGDRILGVLQAGGGEPDLFSPADVELLERVGLRLGAAVEAWWRREDLLALTAMLDDRRRGAESLLAISQMVSAIAHDIKNPLAGMMLAAQRLKKALDSTPGQEKLSYIADRLCVSIKALGDTASEVSDRVREPVLEVSSVDLHEVLDSATILAARRADDQGVRVVRDLAAPAARVGADAHFLRRAFLSLIANALDAMPSGGTLSVSTRALEGGRIEVVIGDTGGGLGAGAVEMLFSPFVSTKPGGAGLGLPLVRRIVELHDGTVSLRRRPAGGSEAVVEIPLSAPGAPT